MASLTTNKAGKYVVCFRLLGKQFNRELGTSDEKEASARLKRIEATIHDIGTGRLSVPDGCFDVGTFVMSDGQAVSKPALPEVITVQNVIDRFLADADGRITTSHVDLEQAVCRLDDNHKLAHLGKVRLIVLCPEAVAILRERVAACPSGLLFPGEDGEQMTAKAIDGRLRRLCVKAGVKHSIPYGYRHSFGTDALIHGIPDATVAALLGHCGTTMLHKHSSHLTSRIQELRAEAAKVKKPA